MRLDRDRLIWLALATLDEAVDNAGNAPSAPSVAVRLALAFLYATGKGDRDAFDSFWQVLRGPLAYEQSDTARSYVRSSYARTQLNRIARSVGVELTVPVTQSLQRIWRGKTGNAGGDAN